MKIWITFLIVVLIFFFVFNFLMLNFYFYDFIYGQLQFGIDSQTWHRIIGHVVGYLSGQSKLDPALFTSREYVHLSDISVLIYGERVVFIFFVLFFLIIFFLFNILHVRESLIFVIRKSSIYGIFTSLFLLIFLPILFVPLFLLFHKIFFTNDFWLLDPENDILIRIFPPEFFLLFVIYYFIICFFVFGFIFFITELFRKPINK